MTFVTSQTTANPVFDYSSRDYASIYSDLLNRIPVYLPEWTSQSSSDFGIVLLQMFAYVGDLIGYYMDRLAGEGFIQTATQASSVINLAAMLDYQPTLSNGATVQLQITIGSNITGPYTIAAGTLFATAPSPTQGPIYFLTTASLTIAGSSGPTPSFVGLVEAIQAVPYNDEAVATSDGTINQQYPLLNNPVSANSLTLSVDIGLGPQPWTEVPSLIDYGPFDQVYTNFVDANGVFYVIFGDGVNGYVPPLGSPVTADYQINVGSVGNVGAGSITQAVTALIGVIGITNPTAASGGTPAESLASIRQNAPASLKTLNRAVTLSDWSTLAIQVPGVQWASVIEATYQLINLFIAPFGGGAPSALLSTQVLNYVNNLDMANTTVTVQAPTYVPINITVQVEVFSNFGNGTTQAAVTAALQTLLNLSNTGFGFRVSLGLVYQVILDQAGVNFAIITSLNRQFASMLTTAITNGSNVTQINVSQLPQPVFSGDQIILNPGATPTQQNIVVAASGAPAGATVIPVGSFTANANYAIGTPVQDATGVQDCVLLANEIPEFGTLTFSPPVTGGLIGS